MIKPYYEENGITIYHGDCREILPHLPKVDLVLTDPPYGIGASSKNFGKWRTSKMEKGNWDNETPSVETLTLAISNSNKSIVFGMNYFELKPTRNFIVWDKGAGFKGRDFAECELAWCSWDGNAKVFQRDPLAMRDYAEKAHPTQKPVALMKWCIAQAGDVKTILDPFMGSGTTLLAARSMGASCIGIEMDEKYCAIAVERLRQQSFSFEAPASCDTADTSTPSYQDGLLALMM